MSNQEQADFWNGDAGQRWVEFSDRLDVMLLPFAELVLEKANITDSDDVIDIGCGAGALSLMASRNARSVLGVDISRPLVELARTRVNEMGSLQFSEADAAAMDTDKKRDLVISRFGVMFFTDPVGTFKTIRGQLSDTGRMVFACWRSPVHNMWAQAPLEAAMPFLTQALAPPDPNAPGPFAFADKDYLTSMLAEAGWSNVVVAEWSGDIQLPGKDAREISAFMMEMGPLSKIIKDQDLDMAPIQAALTEHLSEKAAPDGAVNMGASVWIVSATAT